jgi:hypothetical protein
MADRATLTRESPDHPPAPDGCWLACTDPERLPDMGIRYWMFCRDCLTALVAVAVNRPDLAATAKVNGRTVDGNTTITALAAIRGYLADDDPLRQRAEDALTHTILARMGGFTARTPITFCPYDSDGDGHCGRPHCPYCGGPPR